MATYTDSHGFNKGGAGHSAKGLTKVTMEEVTLDFAKITTARSTAGATALAAGDIMEVISIPADSYVMAVGAVTETVQGAASTFHIGDGSDADGYVASGNANALGGYASNGALLIANNAGKYYSAADTIDITIGASGAALTAAKIKVWAIVADCS